MTAADALLVWIAVRHRERGELVFHLRPGCGPLAEEVPTALAAVLALGARACRRCDRCALPARSRIAEMVAITKGAAA